MDEIIIKECIGFDWDKGNDRKNWHKHHVDRLECEQVFFNNPLLLYEDIQHSQHEERFYVLGHTNKERELFVVFTIRNDLIRVISARDMSKKERRMYHEKG